MTVASSLEKFGKVAFSMLSFLFFSIVSANGVIVPLLENGQKAIFLAQSSVDSDDDKLSFLIAFLNKLDPLLENGQQAIMSLLSSDLSDDGILSFLFIFVCGMMRAVALLVCSRRRLMSFFSQLMRKNNTQCPREMV